MENTNFGYSAKQSAVASSLIISSPVEPEQEFQEFSADSAIALCLSCGSTRVNLVPMAANSPHHAKRVCAYCGAFRGWEASPKNKQKQQQQQTRIAALLESKVLTEWEREFLESVQGKRSLSPRQFECLQKIESKVGGV